MRFVVIYDACVLYPAPLRDLLLHLARTGLFAARWTNEIQQEWSRNLLKTRPELADKLPRTIALMNVAVPDALVTGYEALVDGLRLPDASDRHVLAAAIRAGAQLIVTFNQRDFPEAALATYGIEAVHPDDFLAQQFDLHEPTVLAAVHAHRRSLRKPAKDVDEYLETLTEQKLVATVERLRRFRAAL
ncbi:MAG: PIN domain-containing protein [Xanthomonadales bacterium]|nr:PIN domain-containing protein [Xanthomonadales bacterium]